MRRPAAVAARCKRGGTYLRSQRFCRISDLWPRDNVIEMLNTYFDAISEPIESNGGEILKFLRGWAPCGVSAEPRKGLFEFAEFHSSCAKQHDRGE